MYSTEMKNLPKMALQVWSLKRTCTYISKSYNDSYVLETGRYVNVYMYINDNKIVLYCYQLN